MSAEILELDCDVTILQVVDTDLRSCCLQIYNKHDTAYYSVVLDRNQAHLLMLYLQERLK